MLNLVPVEMTLDALDRYEMTSALLVPCSWRSGSTTW